MFYEILQQRLIIRFPNVYLQYVLIVLNFFLNSNLLMSSSAFLISSRHSIWTFSNSLWPNSFWLLRLMPQVLELKSEAWLLILEELLLSLSSWLENIPILEKYFIFSFVVLFFFSANKSILLVGTTKLGVWLYAGRVGVLQLLILFSVSSSLFTELKTFG